MPAVRAYDPLPCYPPTDGAPVAGWPDACAGLPSGRFVLAIDGPTEVGGAGHSWAALAAAVAQAVGGAELIDVRASYAPWDEIVKRTAPVEALADDPDFATLADGTLADLIDELPAVDAGDSATIVFGPGAALVPHDVLWYADLPKRYAESAMTAGTAGNLGAPAGEPGTTRRLFYIDWPLLDRHRDAIAPDIDRWIDLQHAEPASISGATLRASAAALASRPFRTRPTFNTTSWGGHWAQDELGFNPDASNTALGYELIAPESGVLLGTRDVCVEIPFQVVVALRPIEVLGAPVHEQFGTSFPIRFDYLDTVGGGSLSVHCHPQSDRMRQIFGWHYTQHETYYMMIGGADSVVYLGLRGDARLDEFHARAHDADEHGIAFDIEQFVQTFDAVQHQLFLVPAGTPHGSGKGNVVLEVSATPYLYSLRFYDWLRRDSSGGQRPVHVEHAFANLNRDRRGPDVARDLVQPPRTIEAGDGWRDDLLGALPEMFFEVRRVELEPGATASLATDDRFCVLTVVAGAGAAVRWADCEHEVVYAETMVIPAAVGQYTIAALGDDPVRLVRAFVV